MAATADAATFASHTLLPPAVMLARSRAGGASLGDVEALEAEELGVELLDAALRAALQALHDGDRGRARAGAARRRRRVEPAPSRAVWTQPERKWTLGELAAQSTVGEPPGASSRRDDLGVRATTSCARGWPARWTPCLTATAVSPRSRSMPALPATATSRPGFRVVRAHAARSAARHRRATAPATAQDAHDSAEVEFAA